MSGTNHNQLTDNDKEHYQNVINDLQNQLIDVYNAVKVLQNIQPQIIGASDEIEKGTQEKEEE